MKLLEKTLAIGLGSVAMLYGQEQQRDSSLRKETTFLKEVVVSDAKSAAGFSYQGANQLILREVDLQAYRTRGVAAALNDLAGVEVNGSRATLGAVMSIYARGGRGKQVLLLIDGIRMADPSSASLSYDLRLLDINQVASIKIIKGANSSLYGTNAATLVIDITTKKAAAETMAIEGAFTAGTHKGAQQGNNKVNYSQWFQRLSGSEAGWSYLLSLSAQRSKGLSSFRTPEAQEDPYRQDAQRLMIEKQLSLGLRASFFVDRQFMFASYDDAFMGTDASNSFETIKNSGGTQWVWQKDRQFAKAAFALSSYESVDKSAYGSEVQARNSNAEILYRTFFKKHWNLITGFQLINDQIQENESQGTDFSEYWITDPYVTLGFSKKAFQFQMGARFNYHSAYKGQWVAHFNPSVYLDNKTQYRLYGGISSAYITPTLGMFFGPYGANVNLKPETNQNAEIGVAYDNREGLQWGLTYFNRTEQEAIYFNGPAFLYENNPEDTWSRGFEGQLQSQLSPSLHLSAQYSFVEVSELAIRIPKHKGNLHMVYSPSDDKSIGINLSYTGSRTDTNFTTYENQILAAFTLLDLNYTFPIVKHIGGDFSAHNIFNTDFEETIGYQTLGRNFRFGLHWNF